MLATPVHILSKVEVAGEEYLLFLEDFLVKLTSTLLKISDNEPL